MKKLIFYLFTLFLFAACQQQSYQVRSCGTDYYCEKLEREDRNYYQHIQEVRAHFAKVGSVDKGCNNGIIIPLAFHFMDSVLTEADRAGLERLVKEQVELLNKDFAAKNNDFSKWLDVNALYPDTKSRPSCISFQVATQNHPNNRLRRKLVNGQALITIGEFPKGQSGSGIFEGYLNVWVNELRNGLLGYAPLGGRGIGDGVVIGSHAFGGTGSVKTVSSASTLDRGRTLQHEIGHYLFLYHTHQDDCEGDGDFIDDTPACTVNWGCPSINHATCNSRDLHQNYMSYSNDECMFMFSAHQQYRMEEYARTFLSKVIEKGKSVLSAAPADPPVVVIPPTTPPTDPPPTDDPATPIDSTAILTNMLAEIIVGERQNHYRLYDKYDGLEALVNDLLTDDQ